MTDLSVTLVPDQDLTNALRRDETALAVAQAYVIDSPEMASLCNDELRSVIARTAALNKWRDKFIAPAKQIIENARALFNPALAALEASEKLLRGELQRWTNEQKRLADDARVKAEAEERRLRQEAEATAAAERARAHQQAEEQRRQAAAAEETRQKAVAAGNAKAAAAAAAEAAKCNERAAATLENANAKANEAIVAVQAALPVVAAPEKVGGFSLRDNWKLELLPGQDERAALPLIVAAIAGGRVELLALLTLNMSAGDKLAKALKQATNVPGMHAVNRQTSMSRAA